MDLQKGSHSQVSSKMSSDHTVWYVKIFLLLWKQALPCERITLERSVFADLVLFLPTGIMAILFSGIVMSHYTHHNLSPVTQILMQQTLRTVAFMCGRCCLLLNPVFTVKNFTCMERWFCWEQQRCEFASRHLCVIVCLQEKNSWEWRLEGTQKSPFLPHCIKQAVNLSPILQAPAKICHKIDGQIEISDLCVPLVCF